MKTSDYNSHKAHLTLPTLTDDLTTTFSGVSSFDVFDTALVRRVGNPQAIFEIVGRTLVARALFSGDAAVYRVIRLRAEEDARRRRGLHYSFAHIHAELRSALNWSPETSQAAQQIELTAERETMVAVPAIAHRIAEARRANRRIIFVSDMYLPKWFIGELLENAGLFNAGDGLYVSVEVGAGKQDGRIFAEIERKEGLSSRAFQHIGNNCAADVERPRQAGWRAQYFESGDLGPAEAYLQTVPTAPRLFSEQLAGASRLARLEVAAGLKHGDPLVKRVEMAAAIAAPVMYCFGLWLCEQLRSRGLRRVYFLSRDGYVLKKFFDLVRPGWLDDVDSRYLYVSRGTLHPAAFTRFDEDTLEWIFAEPGRLTAFRLMGRLGLAWDDVNDRQLLGPALPNSKDGVLSRSVQAALRQGFVGNEALRKRVFAGFNAQRIATTAYLQQEGLKDPEPYAIVDLGWNGRMQRSISQIAEHRSSIAGLYLGLTEKTPNDGKFGSYSAFLFDGRTPAGRLKTAKGGAQAQILESFCCEFSGTTVGYEKSTGQWRPIRREIDREGLRSWGLQAVHDTYDRFGATLADNLPDKPVELGAFVSDIVTRCVRRPYAVEANAWGSFPFESDQNEVASVVLASPVRLRSIQHLGNALRGRFTFAKECYWLDGSRQISNPIEFWLSKMIGLPARKIGSRLVKLSASLGH